MSSTFLDIPADSRETDADPDAAKALVRAYLQFQSGAFREMLVTLVPYALAPVSDRQYVRVRYLRAFAWSRLGEFVSALQALDEAFERVQYLDDVGAIAEVLALRGATYYFSNQFRRAARSYRDALAAWRIFMSAASSTTMKDLEFEIDVLIGLGLQLLWLGKYPNALRYVREARRLAALVPNSIGQQARIEWTLALILRWRHDPARALRHALSALNIYEVYGSPAEISRLRTVVADITLDLADSFTDDLAASSRTQLIPLAEPHLLHALAQSRIGEDKPAEGMAMLAYARYLRVTQNRNLDRMSPIEAAGQIALELGDLSLLGQAFTARADEMALREEMDSAKNSYRNALEVLSRGGAPALGMWPERALRLAEEMSD